MKFILLGLCLSIFWSVSFVLAGDSPRYHCIQRTPLIERPLIAEASDTLVIPLHTETAFNLSTPPPMQPSTTDTPKDKSILGFFLLALGITAAIAVPLSQQYADMLYVEANMWHSLAAIGPALAAILLILFGNAERRNRYWAQLKPRKPSRSDILNLMLLLGIGVLGLVVSAAVNGSWLTPATFAEREGFTGGWGWLAWLLPALSYGFFEELGWRGYLLPRFQNKQNAWKSSIWVYVFWILWHLPFFFYRFDWAFLPVFAIILFPGAILFTHVHNSSKGNLWVTISWHILFNIISTLDGKTIAPLVSVTVFIWAIWVYHKRGKATLSKQPAHTL